jgi:hypothetical protein
MYPSALQPILNLSCVQHDPTDTCCLVCGVALQCIVCAAHCDVTIGVCNCTAVRIYSVVMRYSVCALVVLQYFMLAVYLTCFLVCGNLVLQYDNVDTAVLQNIVCAAVLHYIYCVRHCPAMYCMRSRSAIYNCVLSCSAILCAQLSCNCHVICCVY